ncbi:MAG: DUF6751 family protein [Oscillospiraceae bacterium]|nr:DUF6751 family protein [Oscillospiraceae bacterium]
MFRADETVTLYNGYLDQTNGYDVFKRRVLAGVSWFGTTKTTISAEGGLLAANELIIRIPSELTGYVDPKSYTGAAGTWTLKPGDVIIKGTATEEAPRTGDLKAKYSELLTIIGVTDNRKGREPHFKVVGK